MPEALSDSDFAALLLESDPFKLGIRGATAIEAEIDAGIATLAEAPIPRELQAARYELRLAVAVAIGLVAPEDRPLFAAIAKLRNDLAHGKISHLTTARGQQLLDAATTVLQLDNDDELAATLADTRTEPAIVMLRSALMVARSWIRHNTKFLVAQREEERLRAALDRAIERRRAAIAEEIEEATTAEEQR